MKKFRFLSVFIIVLVLALELCGLGSVYAAEETDPDMEILENRIVEGTEEEDLEEDPEVEEPEEEDPEEEENPVPPEPEEDPVPPEEDPVPSEDDSVPPEPADEKPSEKPDTGHNKVPATGDDQSLSWWLALMGSAVLTICVCSLILIRKRSKKSL